MPLHTNDILREGWKYLGKAPDYDRMPEWFSKGRFYLKRYEDGTIQIKETKGKPLFRYEKKFQGDCPDVKIFQLLCKLLKVTDEKMLF